MIDMQRFEQFRDNIAAMGQIEPHSDLWQEQRLANAKKVFLKKIDRTLATDLESCIHCGHCASACHFHESTQNPKYTPIRKLELLKQGHGPRKISIFRDILLDGGLLKLPNPLLGFPQPLGYWYGGRIIPPFYLFFQ